LRLARMAGDERERGAEEGAQGWEFGAHR
jgi:hypothetical protein